MRPRKHYLRFIQTLVVAATAGCQPVGVLLTDSSIDVRLDANATSVDTLDQGIDALPDRLADAREESIDATNGEIDAGNGGVVDACRCYDLTEDAGSDDVNYCTPGTFHWLEMRCGAGAGPLLPPDLRV